MPWVVRDTVDEINRAVGRRWQGLDRLLPPRAELPEGCAAPFVAAGANGRPAGPAAGPRPAGDESLVIREAGPADLDVVTELEMGVIRYDALFGAAILRPATEELVRAETQAALAVRPARAWLAERDGEPVGLVHVQPPEQSRWIAGMTRAGVTVYLQTMFVRPGDRGGGVGEALVRHVHAVLDARGVDTTLLHFAQ